MEEGSYVVPKHLDDPPMYLIWDADEALAFLIPFCVLLIYQAFIVGLIIGVVCMRALGQLKAVGGTQLIRHGVYWYTPSDWWFKFTYTPPSHRREFIG